MLTMPARWQHRSTVLNPIMMSKQGCNLLLRDLLLILALRHFGQLHDKVPDLT